MEKLLKYLMLLLVATFSLTFTSCGGDDDEPSAKSLTGTWIGHTDSHPDDKGFVYTFNSNGTGTAHWEDGGRVDTFTKYEISNNHLLLMWNGNDEYDDKGTIIIINDKSFKLDMNSSDVWWTFVKQ